MRSVQAKWEESTFLDWVARVFHLDRSLISLDTVVPSTSSIDVIIDHLVWDQCSTDRSLLPSDRLPTFKEVRNVFYNISGGD